ncbi:peroxiredoxin family protein [Colwellia sp. D2M02]|uniref:peroxiredoxin family protein n=1 Tax=Colwellia sp. D2M02 TaxID=2841562 RepID=UPI001C08A579|nr:peroxiredoxin family protein [Colwellia sp. D2M02]MBU2892316.1 peroxiredoxin family protein [Colwellia sp. D2M02]
MKFFIRQLKNLALTGLCLSLTLASATVFANPNSLPVGPEVGTQAPEITAKNNQGKEKTISQLSGEKGLIILFFRSADWCPFCKKHLIELNQEAQKFIDLGYGLAGISYDSSSILTTFATAQNISYPLLSDQQAQTMLSYGIVNTKYKKGDDNYGIPYPGVVVIDADGKITHKNFFEGYKKRVQFTQLYQALK